MKIPIVIGVTGHRNLRTEDVPELRKQVNALLRSLMARYPHSPFVLLSSAAEGADTIAAECALDLGIKVVCPLPLPVEDYRKDFEGEALSAFTNLLSRAETVFPVPEPASPHEPASRDDHYRAAGCYVVTHCHVLLALYDGSEAAPDGCGAAETVNWMLNGIPGADAFRSAKDGAVFHLFAPKRGSTEPLRGSIELIEARPGCLHEMLKATDGFNREAEAFSDEKTHYECAAAKERPLHKRFEELSSEADTLALRAQKRSKTMLAAFSLFGVLLVLFFLLYDEMESDLFLILYGALLAVYFVCFLVTRRLDRHGRYLRYRVLSETARAETYLAGAGILKNVADGFTWTEKQDFPWIRKGIAALLLPPYTVSGLTGEDLKKTWIRGQLTYHQNALQRETKQRRFQAAGTAVLLAASVLLFFAVLFLEFVLPLLMEKELLPDAFPAFFLHHAGQPFTPRSLFKILLGGVSALTVFLANYYGKLSLDRKCEDHEKMIALYETALRRFDAYPDDRDALFLALAREELIECGSWYSYCIENRPTFSL